MGLCRPPMSNTAEGVERGGTAEFIQFLDLATLPSTFGG